MRLWVPAVWLQVVVARPPLPHPSPTGGEGLEVASLRSKPSSPGHADNDWGAHPARVDPLEPARLRQANLEPRATLATRTPRKTAFPAAHDQRQSIAGTLYSAQRFAQAFPESHHEHEPYSPAYLRAENPAVKLVLTTPHLKGETRNPLEFLRVIGDDHAIFGQGVRGDHQVHVADGLTPTFQRGSHLGIVVSRVDGPGPHLENFAAPSLAAPKRNSAATMADSQT